MGKSLSEMTLEELWVLFPIILTEHREVWKRWYKEQEQLLLTGLAGLPIVRISHIGSTAIPGIWAKPIIDILVEVKSEISMALIMPMLEKCGFRCMNSDDKRMSFNKGYTEQGFAQQVYHLHLRYAGDHDELYFRDYLLEHPEAARDYEALKLHLWKKYEHDRDGYTQQKAEMVARYTRLAKAEYPERYEKE